MGRNGTSGNVNFRIEADQKRLLQLARQAAMRQERGLPVDQAAAEEIAVLRKKISDTKRGQW